MDSLFAGTSYEGNHDLEVWARSRLTLRGRVAEYPVWTDRPLDLDRHLHRVGDIAARGVHLLYESPVLVRNGCFYCTAGMVGCVSCCAPTCAFGLGCWSGSVLCGKACFAVGCCGCFAGVFKLLGGCAGGSYCARKTAEHRNECIKSAMMPRNPTSQ